MIFDEKNEDKYYGNYRAKIESIDTTLKSGVYKVRVYPFMATLQTQFLPSATSTLTTRFSHINLEAGDWCWVFFENGDRHFPVIFDLCNIKDDYPISTITYGKYTKFQFGDNQIEFNEDTGALKVLNTGKYHINVSSSGDISIVAEGTVGSVTVKATTIYINGGNVVLGDGGGYLVTCPTPGTPGNADGMPLMSSTKHRAGV